MFVNSVQNKHTLGVEAARVKAGITFKPWKFLVQNPESSLDFHIPLNTQQTPETEMGPWETQPGHTKQRNGDGRLKEWVTNYLKQELLKKQLVWGKEGHDKTAMGPDKTPRKAPWSHFCPQNSPWPRSFPTQVQDKLDLTPIILCSFPPHSHGHDITPPKKQPRISPGWDKLNIYNPRVTSAAPHPMHTTKDFFPALFLLPLNPNIPSFSRQLLGNSVFSHQEIWTMKAFHQCCCPRTFPKDVVGWAEKWDCSLVLLQDAHLSGSQNPELWCGF